MNEILKALDLAEGAIVDGGDHTSVGRADGHGQADGTLPFNAGDGAGVRVERAVYEAVKRARGSAVCVEHGGREHGFAHFRGLPFRISCRSPAVLRPVGCLRFIDHSIAHNQKHCKNKK